MWLPSRVIIHLTLLISLLFSNVHSFRPSVLGRRIARGGNGAPRLMVKLQMTSMRTDVSTEVGSPIIDPANLINDEKVSHLQPHIEVAPMLPLTDENFEETIKNELNLSLCFFSSGWCGPCQQMEETLLNEVMPAIASSSSVSFYKVDTDFSADVTTTYSIRSIPSLVIFKRGKVVSEIIGSVPGRVVLGQIMKHAPGNEFE